VTGADDLRGITGTSMTGRWHPLPAAWAWRWSIRHGRRHGWLSPALALSAWSPWRRAVRVARRHGHPHPRCMRHQRTPRPTRGGRL